MSERKAQQEDQAPGAPLRTDEDSMAGYDGDFFADKARWHRVTSRGNPRRLKALLENEKMINFRDPISGQTTLHRLAAGGARAAIRVLLGYEGVDFLARDRQGRLASEIAFVAGRDPALCRLLEIKERKQNVAQGKKDQRRGPS